MSNADQLVALGQRMFLELDQEALLCRYPLEHDDDHIWITFLGRHCRINRHDGSVWVGSRRAGFCVALTVLDLMGNPVGKPVATGSWITVQEASQAASAPRTDSVLQRGVSFFAGKAAELDEALASLGGWEVAGGEVSRQLEVVEGMPIWVQFWDGDDEFPCRMTFLWDRSIRLFLHFETMWYVMMEVIDRCRDYIVQVYGE